jgi:hypothetical protein
MTDTKKDWRELAARASVETDPAKLIVVIAELAKALEESRRGLAGATAREQE